MRIDTRRKCREASVLNNVHVQMYACVLLTLGYSLKVVRASSWWEMCSALKKERVCIFADEQDANYLRASLSRPGNNVA